MDRDDYMDLIRKSRNMLDSLQEFEEIREYEESKEQKSSAGDVL